MSRAESPALRGTFLGWLLRSWNPVMRRLLGSRLHWPWSRWFLLLTYTGRRSGRAYTFPASYVREGDDLFLTTGDGWWHNFVDGGAVHVRLRGRLTPAHAVAVTDPSRSTTEHERLFGAHAWFRRLAGIPATADGRPDRAALAASVAAGRTLIRIDLTPWPPA